MSYLVFHHGSYYFQLRVPVKLRPHHGSVVRVNLQTQEAPVEKVLALKLASEWLARFDAERFSPVPVAASPVAAAIPFETPAAVAMVPNTAARTDVASPEMSATNCLAARAAVTDQELLLIWQRLDTDRAPSTVKEMKSAIRCFRLNCTAPIENLTRLDMAQYRDTLLSRDKLARKTVSKQIGMISTLLQVGYESGLLQQNVARGLKIPTAEVPTLERRNFTAEEIERLFALPVYSAGRRPAGAGGEACIWMPMIALVTGARLEEIAQLRTSDVAKDPEYGPLLRVTDEDDSQRQKTDGSRRVIPLHRELVATGFLDYVESVRDAGHKWLFPALEPDHDGRRGANFGKWFMRQIRSRRRLGIADRRLVFYAFRHGFKTMCRAAGIPEDVHDALTGHVAGAWSRHYGEMPVAPRVEPIGKIRLPVNLPRVAGGVRRD